jgi:hypothetical protein
MAGLIWGLRRSEGGARRRTGQDLNREALINFMSAEPLLIPIVQPPWKPLSRT